MRLVRTFNVGAWAIAFSLTAISAVVINAIAFKKIKKLSLTDAK